jgi:iron complex outermembrane receptor protein
LIPASQLSSRPYEFSSDIDPNVHVDIASVSLRGNIKAGPGTLTTTTAYTHLKAYVLSDLDYSSVRFSQAEFPPVVKTFEQELVYTTDQLGKFRGTFGAFAYYMKADDVLSVNNFLQAIWTDEKNSAYAGFGELTYDITDQLSITGGLRYSYEKKKAYATVVLGSSAKPASLPMLGQKSWGSVTSRASLLYKVTDHTNVYFTFSQGFKSGAFNVPSLQATPVDPEKVNAYEVGAKSTISRDLSASAAAFYYDYTGLQIPAIISQGARLLQALTNATNAEIYGAELNLAWNATEELNFTLGGTYLHARYSSFPNAVVLVPLPAGGNASVSKDISGNTMLSSPTWSGSLTGRYTKATNVGTFDFSGIVYYSTKLFFDIGDRITQPAYATVNASLAWRPNDSNWQVKFWGKNLTDHPVLLSTTISSLGDAGHYTPPRTFGVELKYAF